MFLKCNVEFYNLVFLHVERDSTTQTTLIILSSNFIDCVNVKATFGQLNQQKYEGFFLLLLLFCITQLQTLRPARFKVNS